QGCGAGRGHPPHGADSAEGRRAGHLHAARLRHVAHGQEAADRRARDPRRSGGRGRYAMSLLRTAAIAALLVPTTTAAEVIQSKSGPVTIERLAALEEPWGMAFLSDGRLLVTEKPGRLRIYSDGKLSEPVGGVPKVSYYGQGGLLDVEIDPDFARNGLVYLSYAEDAEQQPKDARDVPEPRFGNFVDK